MADEKNDENGRLAGTNMTEANQGSDQTVVHNNERGPPRADKPSDRGDGPGTTRDEAVVRLPTEEGRGQEEQAAMDVTPVAAAKPLGWWQRFRLARQREREQSRRSLEEPVTMTEVTALIHYAVDHNVDPEATITAPLNDAVNSYKAEKDLLQGSAATWHRFFRVAWALFSAVRYAANSGGAGLLRHISRRVDPQRPLHGLTGANRVVHQKPAPH